jgi:hypothetical protein
MKTIILYKWQIIALTEFLVIAFLIVIQIRRKKQLQPEEIEILQSKKSDINMDDLMQNMHLSNALYKELSRKCHPDRFAGTILEPLAQELFQLVQQSKSNYNELVLLKEKAIIELKIKAS